MPSVKLPMAIPAYNEAQVESGITLAGEDLEPSSLAKRVSSREASERAEFVQRYDDTWWLTFVPGRRKVEVVIGTNVPRHQRLSVPCDAERPNLQD